MPIIHSHFILVLFQYPLVSYYSYFEFWNHSRMNYSSSSDYCSISKLLLFWLKFSCELNYGFSILLFHVSVYTNMTKIVSFLSY